MTTTTVYTDKLDAVIHAIMTFPPEISEAIFVLVDALGDHNNLEGDLDHAHSVNEHAVSELVHLVQQVENGQGNICMYTQVLAEMAEWSSNQTDGHTVEEFNAEVQLAIDRALRYMIGALLHQDWAKRLQELRSAKINATPGS